MPALAWVATVRPGIVRVDHGASVRHEGEAFFEGTWSGPSSLAALPEASTVFGSGMVARGGELMIIGPSHQLEGVYFARLANALVASNSLTGLLVVSGLQLDPTFDYPALFLASSNLCWLIEERTPDGSLRLLHSSYSIPTLGPPISAWFYDNALVGVDLTVSTRRKPRERAFASFADFEARLVEATRSLFRNGRPHEPVVALSSGYDSTAVAAVARQAGCTRSVGFATSRPAAVDGRSDDSGSAVAAALGLTHDEQDRLAYRQRADMVEAEFLSSGMAAEDTMLAGLEAELRRSILLTGYWAGTEWAMARRDDWRRIEPTTTAGADLGEFRLRADFIHVPLPVFGAARPLDAPSLLDRAEMDPFRVGGRYDRPVPRRLAEDAGVPRGTFAASKRAANVLLPLGGLAAFTPASRAAIESYAAQQGVRLSLQPRRRFSRLERAALRASRRLRLAPLTARLGRRRAERVHFEAASGTTLLRWAVSVVGERYADVERA